MVSLTLYDVIAIGLLVFFALRGAMKGVVFQLASLVAIFLCFWFSGAISDVAGPYVHLDPPLNNWLIFIVSYVVLTFACFLVARALNEVLERYKMKEFDRNLGAVLGLIKGAALVVVLTFVVVTMSERAREAIKYSYTGVTCARLMDRLHPILPMMPESLHKAIEKYIHQLDGDHVDLEHAHAHDDPTSPNLGDSSGFPILPNSSSGGAGGNSTIPGSTTGSGDFLSQMSDLLKKEGQTILKNESQKIAADMLKNLDPQTRAQVEQGFQSLVNNASESERAKIQQEIASLTPAQVKQYLENKLTGATGSTIPNPIPIIPGSGSRANTQREALSLEVAQFYAKSDVQQQSVIVEDIKKRTSGVPDVVVVAALQDWVADIKGLATDPDPGTNYQHPIELRLLRQMKTLGVGLTSLTNEAQEYLKRTQEALTRQQGSQP